MDSLSQKSSDLQELQKQIAEAELKSKGRIIEDFDILIASIAIVNHCILITNNIEHFNRIGDLQMQNWLDKDISGKT